MTAKTAGTIQAAETIIQGRKRGVRTASQYRWSSARATPIDRSRPFASREAPLAY
ncbi:MAG TPA: hypothetical protein VJS13_08170 [Pyrinomonadaceae bacterium]|nr:hypothetical protein [Pyrinomonadaceae bacterium]